MHICCTVISTSYTSTVNTLANSSCPEDHGYQGTFTKGLKPDIMRTLINSFLSNRPIYYIFCSDEGQQYAAYL